MSLGLPFVPNSSNGITSYHDTSKSDCVCENQLNVDMHSFEIRLGLKLRTRFGFYIEIITNLPIQQIGI